MFYCAGSLLEDRLQARCQSLCWDVEANSLVHQQLYGLKSRPHRTVHQNIEAGEANPSSSSKNETNQGKLTS